MTKKEREQKRIQVVRAEKCKREMEGECRKGRVERQIKEKEVKM